LGHPVKSFKLQSPQIRYSTVPVLYVLSSMLYVITSPRKKRGRCKTQTHKVQKTHSRAAQCMRHCVGVTIKMVKIGLDILNEVIVN